MAKEAEALAMNVEEALVKLKVCHKMLADKVGEPPLSDNILNLIDNIIVRDDPMSILIHMLYEYF